MTQTELNSAWIKSEKKKIINLINKLNSIITEQNFNFGGNQKYDINFQNSMSGNSIEIRVYDNNTKQVDYADLYLLQSIFEEQIFFNKSDLHEKIINATYKINKMIETAKKYADLNKKHSK